MATTTAGTITSNTVTGAYNASWASLFTLMLKPQYWDTLIQRFGPALGLFEALYFAGQTIDVKQHTHKVFEEGSYERAIVTGEAETAVAIAGADVTMLLAAAQFDAKDKAFLQVGDKVMIPAKYLTYDGAATIMTQGYQVTAVSGDAGASKSYTLKPLDTKTALAVAIPGGTSLMVTGGNFAPGSQGALPKTMGWFEREYKTAIKRTAWAIEGSQQSDERYYDTLKGGGMGMFSKATIEADFRLNAAINDELLVGQVIDNLTLANRDSDNNTARGTKGIWPTLVEKGMKLYYNGAMTIPDFDNIKDLFISMGVTDTKASLFAGSELLKDLENSGLDFIKEFSGGTDFTKAFKGIGVEINAVKKNGIFMGFHELVNSSNPNKYGITDYNFPKWGFVIPDTQVTVREGSEGGVQMKMKNLVFGNKNHNGENRGRFINTIPGVNAMPGKVGTNIAVDRYDDVRGELGSEFMLIANKMEQAILIKDV